MKRIFFTLLVAMTCFAVYLSIPLGWYFHDLREVSHRVTVIGYERSQFGDGWALQSSGCSTRDEVLAATLIDAHLTVDCSLTRGYGDDPYSLRPIAVHPGRDREPIELDHVYPLSAAWDMGAFAWDKERRIAFANDPLNLVAASKQQNRQKSDKLPSEWLPSARKQRCWYVNRLADVARKYDLPLSSADLRVMRRQC
ncbi:HNH endonuclease [Corynebacterium diphtheriae]|nr:HNH endonuclease [Corynebacterium diphtheriae]